MINSMDLKNMTNQMKILFANVIFLVCIFGVSDTSHAQTLINNFKDWSAFSVIKGKSKICYIASVPKKETGEYTARGNTYILVTHRPDEKKRDIFELRAGYIFKKDSEAVLNIDGQIIKLYTDRGTAWAEDDIEPKILKLMIRGKSMKVTGFLKRGTKTEDFYSLIGFTSAYNAISKACGVL